MSDEAAIRAGDENRTRVFSLAQLRGMLEMVDSMIDDIDNVAIPNGEIVEAPPELVFASGLLDVLSETFHEEALPEDKRRLADTVAGWLTAAEATEKDLTEALSTHKDLVEAASLDPASAVLGVLLRSFGSQLAESYDGLFCISPELETLCAETQLVSGERRVQWT